MSTDALRQGIEALQNGNREQARALLEEATRQEPENETAWYYRAAAEDDPALRRVCLERVLAINPGNTRAQEVLERMGAAPVAAHDDADSGPLPGSGGAPSFSWSFATPPPSGTPGEAAVAGLKLPVQIPGAPERVGIAEMFRDGFRLFMRGVAVLQRTPGVLEAEMAEATWWRFWLLVGWASLASVLLTAAGSLLASLFGTILGRGFSGLNLILIVITLIVNIPVALIVDYAGAYGSHWYARQQGSRVTLLEHAWLTVLHYVPASVLGVLVTAASSVLGLSGLGALASLALTIYALYLLGLAYRSLHRFSAPSQEWVTVVALFISTVIAGIAVGIVIGLVTAPFALGAALTGR